ncbi:5-methyltetrahydropteroyltriglutamate--homocysteine methyltransferase [Candidatus Moduliflexus flocculans]|uniref:5-methyltetrahydropteroyltriglutamate--homocysteine methyltransferase n=1 Tax=Candidatus Moduliflexus flocculans TaxID=1499966 RepID=A0A081BMQ8_9BACT|nr:5-methyltetrahydropteroyltriglutamate--homocysteine methyltransferase [Candidatus Moduliflexus flocculans]
MAKAANLGYPRIGQKRELKTALESFWKGASSEQELLNAAKQLRQRHWETQKQAGIERIPSNDFSLYDHVLDTIAMVGAVPPRYQWNGGAIDLPTYFLMARGGQKNGQNVSAMEMTKWFDTNYHYIVPEFAPEQTFRLSSRKPIEEFLEAKQLGIHTRPVLVGPVSFLLSGKSQVKGVTPLSLLDCLLPVYAELLQELKNAGADCVQIDEPFLVLELSAEAQEAYRKAYTALHDAAPEMCILLTTYFGSLQENLPLALSLPVKALHLDLVRAPQQLEPAFAALPPAMSLSLGVVDGRNVWRSDFERALAQLEKAAHKIGKDRVLVAPSCSLMFTPMDVEAETALDADVRSWLAFARQKLDEIALLTRALNEGIAAIQNEYDANQRVIEDRRESFKIHNPAVKSRIAAISPDMLNRISPFPARKAAQQAQLHLPDLPTTTIGSFPQTPEIRQARLAWNKGKMSAKEYETFLRKEIADTVKFQEEIGLDVLVHGESERTDMVEYFGLQLNGFAFTQNGWVQSYGSRCVRPPIIYGDVSRPQPMTVKWSQYAQSLTTKPMKGMLTGPVTILEWSFVRDDQARAITCQQIGLALRDEVHDLEDAGIRVIQIDEPALREGLPLRRSEWAHYLEWAVNAFKLSAAGVKDTTQIHTHMCYAEFNDIIEAIAAMDADVISIESTRSQMELLGAFVTNHYPNDIGPGIYDIHSPRVPGQQEMEELLRKALKVFSPSQIWVNPDCGLKTRRWEEVRPALDAMVKAAHTLRQEVKK